MDTVSDHKGNEELKAPDVQTLCSLMGETGILCQEVAELLHVSNQYS
jgi:hypothetical protein